MKPRNIKAKSLAWIVIVLVSGILAIPKTGFTRDDERHERGRRNHREARQLQGRWYMNGDRNRPAEINGDRARNEKGERSRLEIDRDGDVRAPDWKGVRGHLRGNTIEWDNGTTWTRRPRR